MATDADQLIGTAARELGMNGSHWWGSSTDSEYCRWYPMNGYWCAMFVSWCAASAGALDIIPKHAATTAGATWFKNRGQWGNGTTGIRRGDIVYFKFAGNSNFVNHVGIVESVNSDGSINTIEGNTSGGGGRSGGTVARKTRRSNIVGYGRPAYVTAPPTPVPPQEEDDMFTDADRAMLTEARNKSSWVHQGLFYGSTSNGITFPGLIPTVLGSASGNLVSRIWSTIIRRGDGIQVLQEIADIRTEQLKQAAILTEISAALAATK